jgi:hypothetical protein
MHHDFHIRECTEESIADKCEPERTLLQCLLRGSNTSARRHIRSNHFAEYKKWCEEANPPIKMNAQCIPDEFEKNETKKQTTLKFGAKQKREMTMEGRIAAIAQFITCKNQVGNFHRVKGLPH